LIACFARISSSISVSGGAFGSLDPSIGRGGETGPPLGGVEL